MLLYGLIFKGTKLFTAESPSPHLCTSILLLALHHSSEATGVINCLYIPPERV